MNLLRIRSLAPMGLLGVLALLALPTPNPQHMAGARVVPLGTDEPSLAQRALFDRGIIKGYADGSLGGDNLLAREEEIVLLARFHAYVFLRLALQVEHAEFDQAFRQAQFIVEGELPLEAETPGDWSHAPGPATSALPPEYDVPPTHWAYPAACYLTLQRERNWNPDALLPLRGLTRQEAAEAVYELILKLAATPIRQPFRPTGDEEQPPDVAVPDVAEPLILQLTEGRPLGEWGDPEAPTKVLGYVPDSPCHNACVDFLVHKAQNFPSELHVILVRMFTAEGMNMMREKGRDICAAYEINGQDTFTFTASDGSTREAVFKRSPEAGGYSLDDLRMAVEQAILQAKTRQEQERSTTYDTP